LGSAFLTGWSTGCSRAARTEDEIVGPGGVLARSTERLVERALRLS
jgi:hypothetical protein